MNSEVPVGAVNVKFPPFIHKQSLCIIARHTASTVPRSTQPNVGLCADTNTIFRPICENGDRRYDSNSRDNPPRILPLILPFQDEVQYRNDENYIKDDDIAKINGVDTLNEGNNSLVLATVWTIALLGLSSRIPPPLI